MSPQRDLHRTVERLRREMRALMMRIQDITNRQIEMAASGRSEDELADDPLYVALAEQKAQLGQKYRSLAERFDSLKELLDD